MFTSFVKSFYDAVLCNSVKKKSANSVLSQKTLDVISRKCVKIWP